eukprot:CAMPEP_0194670640 /NCGR_PEP_ID=MMETSP0295-20121207/5328_1 /TAXON_ID=39354 /ORGANISM="Heterosigma akashiwo, Strain CCMP2393" /LENGTH=118 /DNA_ID=CAMNT_0039553913 /DNA_START=11 /DNA_END=364 /DNA_ORIENTATION=-
MAMDDMEQVVDTAFLKAPAELLSQSFRNTQKQVTREITAATKQVNELAARAQNQEVTPEEMDKELEGLVTRLLQLKEKVKESDKTEDGHLRTLEHRLQLLTDPDENDGAWWLDRAVGA